METFSALLALCVGNSPVPVNSPHKGQWRGALMFSLICARINDWVNNREAGNLRRHRGHYDVIVMWLCETLVPSRCVSTAEKLFAGYLFAGNFCRLNIDSLYGSLQKYENPTGLWWKKLVKWSQGFICKDKQTYDYNLTSFCGSQMAVQCKWQWNNSDLLCTWWSFYCVCGSVQISYNPYSSGFLYWLSTWDPFCQHGFILIPGTCTTKKFPCQNLSQLTHCGRDKMAANSQTTLSNAFSWMKISEFWLKFHWSLFVSVQLTIFQHWFG